MSANGGGHVFYRNPNKGYPTVDRAEGVYVYDTQGKRYLDGSGGAAVVLIGHGIKEIRDAMLAQAEKVSFTHGTHFTSEPAIRLAEKLVSMAPPTLSRVYFISGGSEGVETAVKMARQYQVDRGAASKFKVISRWTSYHGNTMGALALSGHTGRRRYHLPLMLHTPHISPAYCYRCPFGSEPGRCGLECAEELGKTILYEGPDSVSAFIAEPVVGATAGALVPPDGYFQRIREICDKFDVLLISDEVMTGVGRTGKNFGIDHWSRPDMIVCAKGLGSGYTPLYCVIADENVHSAIKEGTGNFIHGFTYGQNPQSCAVGLAVLEFIEKNGLIARSVVLGEYLLGKLKTLLQHPIVGDVRGLGLFAGVEFVRDKTSKEPFDPKMKLNALIANRAFEKGLITYPGGGGADGIRGDHILIAPPFIITEEQIDFLIAVLDESIGEITREQKLA